jgi:hypothetical protein
LLVITSNSEPSAEDAYALAKYARVLEEEFAKYKPKEKSPEEIQDAADALRGVIARIIEKQMKVCLFSCLESAPQLTKAPTTVSAGVQDVQREALV